MPSPLLDHYIKTLISAIEKVDYLTYQQTWLAYQADDSINDYPISGALIMVAIQRVYPPETRSDQVKIFKSLLLDHNSRNFEWVYVMRIACRHGNLEIVKLLLARGCDVTMELLDYVLNYCFPIKLGPTDTKVETTDTKVETTDYLAERIEILMLLLKHCPFNLNWVFIYGLDLDSRANDLTWDDYDQFVCSKVIRLDHSRVNRAILLSGIAGPMTTAEVNPNFIKRPVYSIVYKLHLEKAVNSIRMLAGLGLIDQDTIQEYN